MRRVIAIAVAAALAGCSPAHRTHTAYTDVKTEIAPEHRVRVGDLVGLSPAAVQRKLTALPAAWPTPMGLEVASPDGVLAFANLGDWMQDAAGREIGRRGADHVDFAPTAFSGCEARFADLKDAPMTVAIDDRGGRLVQTLVKETLAGPVALEFRNGRFLQAWSVPDHPYAPNGPRLEGGAGFTRTWARQPLGADVALDVTCWTRTPEPADDADPGGGDLAGDMQGLAGLPLAPWLLVLNHRRTAAMRDGGAVYDQLAPGAVVPGGVEAFAARHKVIVVRPGADPHYQLLQVDLGAEPGRNLTYFHRQALIGVRDGRVLFRTRLGMQCPWGLGRETEYHNAEPQTVVG